jgi:large subunit ribosomal protein L1
VEKTEVTEALKLVKENSQKRNFKQSIELIVNLKDINLKIPEHQVNLFVQLHYSKGKDSKVCALVGPELLEQAKSVCDNAIPVDEFKTYADKKKAKKLANEYDFFVAQATVMPKVATSFGRVFGPRGKMPNPKAGCVVPPNANLKPLQEKLKKTIRIATRNDAIIQCSVGKEDMKDEEVIDNILTVYNSLMHALPNEIHNIKNVYMKTTMGKPIKVGKKTKEKK